MSSTWWYRIYAINGRTVRSLYKIPYIYAASGLFKALPKPVAVPSRGRTVTEGIDISHWQGTIDWTKVAGGRQGFAYMKASEDIDYVDPTYTTNRTVPRPPACWWARTTSPSPSTDAGRRAWPRPTTSSTRRAPRRAISCRSSTSSGAAA